MAIRIRVIEAVADSRRRPSRVLGNACGWGNPGESCGNRSFPGDVRALAETVERAPERKRCLHHSDEVVDRPGGKRGSEKRHARGRR